MVEAVTGSPGNGHWSITSFEPGAVPWCIFYHFFSKCKHCDFHRRLAALVSGDSLLVVVVGASGDLAKKKTYPALYELFLAKLLSPSAIICGYARTAIADEAFRVRWVSLFPFVPCSSVLVRSLTSAPSSLRAHLVMLMHSWGCACTDPAVTTRQRHSLPWRRT